MFDLRAICATCGHTYERHDRDAMRSRQRDDPGIERPCYREVGGAACRCGGFRGSGELLMPASGDRQTRPAANRLVTNAVLTLLLVVLGLLLLYAYRAQTPSVPQVSLTQAIQDVQAGKIRSVTVVGNKATLEFRNGTQREQTTLPEQDQLFASRRRLQRGASRQRGRSRLSVRRKQLLDHRVDRSQHAPVLLIGGFFYYMMRTREKSQSAPPRRSSAASRARYSVSGAVRLRVLQRRHAGMMFEIQFDPPRESGTRWSGSSFPTAPQ